MLFGKVQVVYDMTFPLIGFNLPTLPWRPDWWSDTEMVILENFSSHLYRRLDFDYPYSLRMMVPHFLAFTFIKVTVLHTQNFRNPFIPFFFLPLPWCRPQHDITVEIYIEFLWLHLSFFSLACIVNLGTLHTAHRAFPNCVQSLWHRWTQINFSQKATDHNLAWHSKRSEHWKPNTLWCNCVCFGNEGGVERVMQSPQIGSGKKAGKDRCK